MERWHAVGEREVSPFQILGSTTDYAIEKAKTTDEGSTLEILTAMLMAPMMVEALLNHVGEELFVTQRKQPRLWELIERSSPIKKLDAICEAAGLKPDYSVEPFQHLASMFQFRNLIAHGRTETVHGEVTYSEGERRTIHSHREFMPKWEQQLSIENAERYNKAAEDLVSILCKATGVRYPVDHGGWVASRIPEAD